MSYPHQNGGYVDGPHHDPYASNERFVPPEQYDSQPYEMDPAPHEYPPTRANDYHDSPDDWSYGEKAMNPVTRGSIAAQMAAEGQIPKKEGLRMWRSDEHAGALMKGGRGRCCGRVCCCSIILVIVLLVGIIAAFFLWVRPPSVNFNGVEPPSNGSEVAVQPSGFLLNFNLNIGVINPNFFGADFQTIDAVAYYSAAPTTPFGGGSLPNVNIPKNSNTTIRFPFSVNYTTAIDPNLTILRDIATRCGFLGSTISQLKVNYTIKLSLKVLAIKISPQFSSSTSFDCPLKESDISGLLGSGGLAGLGSASRRSLSAGEEHEAQLAVAKVMKRGYDSLLERARGDLQ